MQNPSGRLRPLEKMFNNLPKNSVFEVKSADFGRFLGNGRPLRGRGTPKAAWTENDSQITLFDISATIQIGKSTIKTAIPGEERRDKNVKHVESKVDAAEPLWKHYIYTPVDICGNEKLMFCQRSD